MKSLFEKYNQQAPRYTSYPAMPYWKNNMDERDWFSCLEKGLELDPRADMYIHVPFCAKLCWYCGCNRVITKNQSEGDRYLDGLLKELEIYTETFPHLKIRSLHLGGGTPNFLTPKQMRRMLDPFTSFLSDDFEGAIEVDPRTCTIEQFQLLADFGFTRISFGVQDFDPEVQKAINRIQDFEMVEKVCAEARAAGFKHVNFDLIWGLPKQSPQTIARTVGLSDKLAPEQISFYSYAHLPSRFKHQNLIKASDILEGEDKRKLYDTGKELFEKAGYSEIGMDHYAKKGSVLDLASRQRKLTRNFMGYTDEKAQNLIGLGASAISSNSYGYVQNEKDLE
ncbi:MAG: oxygen-independent coproporphyrinogen III oxidase, partial [Bacteriovoracaceae bacterium]